MAEVLTYSQSLTSMTGGRGDYHMQFLRYEEVPTPHRPEADRRARRRRARPFRPERVTCEQDFLARPPAPEKQLRSPRAGDAGQLRAAVRRLRAHAPDGRAHGALLARTAASATSTSARSAGDRARARLDQGGLADHADDPGRPPARAASRSPRCSARAGRAEAPVASEPILRRLSEAELAIVEAADHFNASQFRRTVGGIAKSLGTPRVSITPLSGVNQEIVITVAWEISWYQYRVTPGLEPARPARGARPRARRARRHVHRLERPDGRGRPDRPRHRAASERARGRLDCGA